MLPVTRPVACVANFTLNWTLVPARRVYGNLGWELMLKSVPVTAAPVRTTFFSAVLATVAARVAELPTGTPPNLRGAGVTLIKKVRVGSYDVCAVAMAGRIASEATITRDITVVIFPRSTVQNATSNSMALCAVWDLAFSQFLLRKGSSPNTAIRVCLLCRSEKYMIKALRSLHTRGMNGKTREHLHSCSYPKVPASAIRHRIFIVNILRQSRRL